MSVRGIGSIQVIRAIERSTSGGKLPHSAPIRRLVGHRQSGIERAEALLGYAVTRVRENSAGRR
jgi:hypothetical protein